MGEKITGVALLCEDGRMFALPRPHRHHHLFSLAAFIGQNPSPHVQGFTTSTGRYVDRIEATLIAGRADQVDGKGIGDPLYSEDVW
jgi:hypothetical protein